MLTLFISKFYKILNMVIDLLGFVLLQVDLARTWRREGKKQYFSVLQDKFIGFLFGSTLRGLFF